MTLATTPATAAVTPHPGVTAAAVADIDDVFASVRSTPDGLSTEQATQRRRTVGPNTVETHRARLWPVLIAQVRSPLLLLLVIAAAVSYVVGEHTDAIIIGVIVTCPSDSASSTNTARPAPPISCTTRYPGRHPQSPLADLLGFQPLPGAFFAVLCLLVVAYLALIEVGKWAFYRAADRQPHRPQPRRPHVRHLRRRAAYFAGHPEPAD
jgi:hypothetical protein